MIKNIAVVYFGLWLIVSWITNIFLCPDGWMLFMVVGTVVAALFLIFIVKCIKNKNWVKARSVAVFMIVIMFFFEFFVELQKLAENHGGV